MATLVYVVDCLGCKSSTRVEVVGQAAVPANGPGHFYCPCCGSLDNRREYRNGQHEDEYFYVLAKAMGLKANEEGAMAAKAVYALWDTDEHHRFIDFWQAFERGED